jgi:mandelamide amidase
MSLQDDVSRRTFLKVTGAHAAGFAAGADVLRAMAQREALWELSATEAVAAMRRGEIASERYASALLARCQAAQSLTAFITLWPERVLEAARAADKRRQSTARLGALHGLPIPLKDSINTRDLPTTGGTRALLNFQPRVDAPLVTRLRDADAIVLGRTNLHEISGAGCNTRAEDRVNVRERFCRGSGCCSGRTRS